ncbi:hypothetical protein QJQ45_007213 [Haematococcus lacustris]|nr:hypothetical protein QJQ45_007213 [Haematococcus lacustris]
MGSVRQNLNFPQGVSQLSLQLCRDLPRPGERAQPSAAVAAVLAAHPDLCARLEAIPRYHSDTNMVDHVGQQLQAAFSNMLTLLFAGRLKKSVSLAKAKVLLGTRGHLRRFGEGGVVVIPAMQAEVVLQRGLLGLEEGERVTHGWLENPTNRSRLLRHAVHTTREMEAAMAAWQLDMVPWQQSELTKQPGRQSEPRPPRPPTLYAITPTSKCRIKQALAYALLSLQTSSRRMEEEKEDVGEESGEERPGSQPPTTQERLEELAETNPEAMKVSSPEKQPGEQQGQQQQGQQLQGQQGQGQQQRQQQ